MPEVASAADKKSGLRCEHCLQKYRGAEVRFHLLENPADLFRVTDIGLRQALWRTGARCSMPAFGSSRRSGRPCPFPEQLGRTSHRNSDSALRRMHSALPKPRRQYYSVASLPAGEQHAVSRLYSGSGVDAKSAVERVAIEIGRCVSQLLLIQGIGPPDAFCQNQSGRKTSGRNVAGRMAELPVKAIQKPIRSRACDVREGHTRFPLARSEDSVSYLREFSRKIRETSSNRRHYTDRAGPMLTSSHDAKFVWKGYR
jgi:hypothetical protein